MLCSRCGCAAHWACCAAASATLECHPSSSLLRSATATTEPAKDGGRLRGRVVLEQSGLGEGGAPSAMLRVRRGEFVVVKDASGGRLLCETEDGRKGWVPDVYVTPVASASSQGGCAAAVGLPPPPPPPLPLPLPNAAEQQPQQQQQPKMQLQQQAASPQPQPSAQHVVVRAAAAEPPRPTEKGDDVGDDNEGEEEQTPRSRKHRRHQRHHRQHHHHHHRHHKHQLESSGSSTAESPASVERMERDHGGLRRLKSAMMASSSALFLLADRAMQASRGGAADDSSSGESSECSDGDEGEDMGKTTTTTAASEKSKQDEAKAKKARMRAHAVAELIDTERGYCADLTTIADVFALPLQLLQCISEEDKVLIASNLTSILGVNSELLRVLEEGKLGIGDAFISMCSFFGIYSHYCAHFDEQSARVKKLQETVPAFAAFTKSVQENPACKGQPIASFLIKPVQRVCKYPLLLREIIRHTEHDHPELDALSRALGAIGDVVSTINAYKKDYEIFKKTSEIQSMVLDEDGYEFQLLVPSRRFIRESVVIETQTNRSGLSLSSATQEMHHFLFNDVLLRAKKSAWRSKKLMLESCTHVELLEARPLDDAEAKKSNVVVEAGKAAYELRLHRHADDSASTPPPPVTLIVVVDSPGERTGWMQDIGGARDVFVPQSRTPRTPPPPSSQAAAAAATPPPTAVTDEDVDDITALTSSGGPAIRSALFSSMQVFSSTR